MSATNRGAVRRDKGFYETPAWVVDCLVEYLCDELGIADVGAWLFTLSILEPMAGRGAIMRRLIQLGAREDRMRAVELDEGRANCVRREFPRAHTWNASFLGLPFGNGADLVITNPDFAISLETAKRAIRARRGHGIAALLLRLDFMAGVSRAEFHRENPSTALVLPRRPSFCVSAKCIEPQRKKLGCGWRATLDHDVAAQTKVCQGCGGKLHKSQNDAQSYAWFIWGLSDAPKWVVAKEPDGFATREEAQAACHRENKRMGRKGRKKAIEDAIDF